MNIVALKGRLTADPDVRYTQEALCIARYRLAVNRQFKREGQDEADFISCVAFGKKGEFAEKYLRKGQEIAVDGRIQTGSYEKDGQKVYTTEIVVNNHYFCGNKAENGQATYSSSNAGKAEETKNTASDGFVNIDAELEEELPFV